MSYPLLSEKVMRIGDGDKPSIRWVAHSWQRALVLAAIAVLLGRASIEHVVSPFGLAYFAILTELGGKKRTWPGYFAILGAYSVNGIDSAVVIAFEFIAYRLLRNTLFRKKAPDLYWIPLMAGTVSIVGKLVAVGSVWTRYDILIGFAEGALVMTLSLIFIQCVPLFAGHDHSKRLRSEQLVSLVILLGSVIAGFSGLRVDGVPLVQVAVDWVVLMVACGGLGVTTASAIVVGTLSILNHAESLAAVAVLGFAGLLAGMLKDAGRVWIALSFILSMSVLSATSSNSLHTVMMTAIAAVAAAVLYLLSPKKLRQEFATYVPGTLEHKQSEQARVRRINALLSEKIKDMSQVFEELSQTFADTGENNFTSAQQLVTHVVGTAGKQVCSGCPRRAKCWEQEGLQTYQAIFQTVANLEESGFGRGTPTIELRERCIRLDSMMGVLRYSLELTDRDAKWIAKMQEQKTLVAAQLSGVANVVKAIAGEIEEGNKTSLSGEEQILAALEQLGLYVDHVHIVNLDAGKVEIEITQPTQGAYENSVRVIAPLLSGILGEHVTVSQVMDGNTGPCTSVFSSARLFKVKTAAASVARDGRVVSGDTFTSIDLGNGRFAVAVSDGMGNGERAQRESKAAIELLKKLLKVGFDEKLAIKTVNSTLLLRSREEMFTTLDMTLIDLFSAKAEFLKIGSAPSFIRRKNSVFSITGANVPIGILQDIEVQSIEHQLQDGDILILMSDGIYDAPQQVYDKEEWLRKQVERLETNDPQAIADTLIEAAVRMNHGQILDDMTVVVAVVSAEEPEWGAIKLPGVAGIRKRVEKKQRGA